MRLHTISEKKQKKTPKPEDFDKRTVYHTHCGLEDSKIDEETDKSFFSYDIEAKDMWGDKINDARDEFNVSFDTENDDTMDQQRTIRIEQDEWEHVGKVSFACEMYSAGGDWEFPLRYFRCELKNGHAKGISKYSNPHFVFVPNGEQGNGQLTKSDKGKWVCPDSDYDEEEKRNEKQCWDSLKEYLQELVDDEIKKVQSNHQSLPESTDNHASQGKLRPSHQSLVMPSILSCQTVPRKLRHIV